jgi:hypothetical protein
MKFACIVLAAIIAPGSFSLLCGATAWQAGQATVQPKQSEIDSADRLFPVGKFAEAGKLYSQITAQNPNEAAHSCIVRSL